MKRQLNALAATTFDVLVIGGGIYGSSIARDAALRGLSVALIERDDFGAATSANSLKIVHGGLRYLQDGNPARMRQMVRERRNWLRIAPHLVYPLPCVMPTHANGRLTHHRLALAAALLLNDAVGLDRNRGLSASKRLPAGRIISRAELRHLRPELDAPGVTGAAVWHDAHVYNTERLLLAQIEDAAGRGGIVANYVEATGLLRQGARVVGVQARDRLTGEEVEIRARVSVNAAGAWVDDLTSAHDGRAARRFHRSLALNLVTRQLWPGDNAVAAEATVGGAMGRRQTLFIVPWRGYSVVGTLHVAHEDPVVDRQVLQRHADTLLAALNSAFTEPLLTSGDVHHVQAGFLPAVAESGRSPGAIALVREGRVYNHAQEGGPEGLITVVGVKYTTARRVAEQAVDLAARELGRTAMRSRTATTPVSGGDMGDFEAFLAAAQAERPAGVAAATVTHLVRTYGTGYGRILAYAAGAPEMIRPIWPGAEVTAAEVIHAAREEMAMTLRDVVLRRTELGSAGPPADGAVATCAQLLQAELGWSDARRRREVEELYAAYPLQPMRPAGVLRPRAETDRVVADG